MTILAADYRGEPITGKRWRRACRVAIRNPYLGTPTVSFEEEEMTELEGERRSRPTDTLNMNVDLAAKVPLLNPETGEPLGASMTQQEIYVALYSVYRMLASARDQRQGP